MPFAMFSVSIVLTPADYDYESSIENVRIVVIAIGWIASLHDDVMLFALQNDHVICDVSDC